MAKPQQPVKGILPWSLHKGVGGKSQFQRLERWCHRVEEARTKEDLADFIFTFFQNCFHLKDWLKKTDEVPEVDLEKLTSDNIELQICRDICNATKHFSLTTPSQEYEISFIQEYCPPRFGGGWYGGDARLLVVADDKNYDAKELMYKCLNIWKEFLLAKGVL